jgi:uncharacterized protein (DUF433 family)
MTTNIEPKIGEGIFFTKDIAQIFNLDKNKVRRWLSGYWDEHFKTTFGDGKNIAINFYSLIEFYIFYKLRESGISAQELKKAHGIIAEELNSPYPFACADAINFEKRKSKYFIWYEKQDGNVRVDGSHQISLLFIKQFVEKIDYDKNNMAAQFFPLGKDHEIVVDPKKQFGKPIIKGTRITTDTLYHLYLGGESIEAIGKLYNLAEKTVKDALYFHHKDAA